MTSLSNIKETGFKKEQKPIPPMGPQIARCYSIIDLGTQKKQYPGKPETLSHMVHFSFEFPMLPKQVFREGAEPQPLAVFNDYTVSIDEKANLGKLLRAWRNVKDIPLPVDLKVYLGQPLYLQVIHTSAKTADIPIAESLYKDGKVVYANIGTVMSVPVEQRAAIPQCSNPLVFFDLGNFSWETFNQINKYIQGKIMASTEWPSIIAKYGQNPLVETPTTVTAAVDNTPTPSHLVPSAAVEESPF